jgi:hypothetical protein
MTAELNGMQRARRQEGYGISRGRSLAINRISCWGYKLTLDNLPIRYYGCRNFPVHQLYLSCMYSCCCGPLLWLCKKLIWSLSSLRFPLPGGMCSIFVSTTTHRVPCVHVLLPQVLCRFEAQSDSRSGKAIRPTSYSSTAAFCC